MPIFKIRVTRTQEEECVFLAHLPSKDHVATDQHARGDLQDFADSFGNWDPTDDDCSTYISTPTQAELDYMEVHPEAHFGIEPEPEPEKPFVDPRQTSIKFTT